MYGSYLSKVIPAVVIAPSAVLFAGTVLACLYPSNADVPRGLFETLKFGLRWDVSAASLAMLWSVGQIFARYDAEISRRSTVAWCSATLPLWLASYFVLTMNTMLQM